MDANSTSGVSSLARIAVVIPAWQPDHRLGQLVEELAGRAPFTFVVIDDGSDAEHQVAFEILRHNPQVRLLRHADNLGKGRALKTAWNFVLAELPQVTAVVTADADGQHLPEDIVQVAERLACSGDLAVFGCRGFSSAVPFRSRAGNLVTRSIFALFSGVRVSDTQTGLRAFPREMLPELLQLQGERYEYEMTVLAHLCRSGAPPIEVPIATVYLDNNRSSHFHPAWDSMRIYFVLVRFYASSLLASGVDLIGFSLCFVLTHEALLSVVVGRASSLLNFALNRRFVFRNRSPLGPALWRYYLLALSIGSISYFGMQALSRHLAINVLLAKVIVDAALSLLSFSVQRAFVFRRLRDRR